MIAKQLSLSYYNINVTGDKLRNTLSQFSFITIINFFLFVDLGYIIYLIQILFFDVGFKEQIGRNGSKTCIGYCKCRSR